jgi:hypothetical protein
VRQMVVVRHGQYVFNEVVDQYLQRIEFTDDGYAELIRLPGYREATVVVDPPRGFGQPAGTGRAARRSSVVAAGALRTRWACSGRGSPWRGGDRVRSARVPARGRAAGRHPYAA